MREWLAELARTPRDTWKAALVARLDDPASIRQAMLWLAASAASDEEGTPSLGSGDARYELVAPLDRGATATVWQARDRLLDRAVAIKLFHDDSVATSRVIREARAAGDIVSDHVVRVLDVQPSYIVMELIGEHDVLGKLRLGVAASETRPRSLDEAVRWVLQAARGIHDAHLRNVFHRDLNPRNLLITPLSRHAKLADFGLAASRHGDHRFGGTPEYMAPEQARGFAVDTRDPDRRARLVALDIWGLGAIAYALLAGRPPWQRVYAWDRPHDSRPPAIDHTPEGQRIPRRLRRILDKLLALDPADRYRSADEVANELAAVLAARPTTFDGGRVTRVGLWCKRNPQVATTGVVAVALAALVVGGVVTLSRLRDERRELVDELATRKGDRARLAESVSRAQTELRDAELQVTAKTDELRELGRSLAAERTAYVEVLAAKERALEKASVERHILLGRLESLRDVNSIAESTGKLYERFWTASRNEADRATRDRLRVQAERDAARAEARRLHAQIEELRRELERATAPPIIDSAPDPVAATPDDRPPQAD
jgi:serine/threonine protein kinase